MPQCSPFANVRYAFISSPSSRSRTNMCLNRRYWRYASFLYMCTYIWYAGKIENALNLLVSYRRSSSAKGTSSRPAIIGPRSEGPTVDRWWHRRVAAVSSHEDTYMNEAYEGCT